MTTLTEGKHTGEWLLTRQEGTLSFTQGIVLSGQNLADGTVVELNGTKWQTKGTGVTSGFPTVPVAGILYGAVNASGGDAVGVVVDFGAEVKEDLLVYPAGSSPKAATIAGLKRDLHIKVLDTVDDIPSV